MVCIFNSNKKNREIVETQFQIYFSDFENYETNVIKAQEKDTHKIPILQKHKNCFGKNDLSSLNQTFVHLKSLNVDCLSSAGEDCVSFGEG